MFINKMYVPNRNTINYAVVIERNKGLFENVYAAACGYENVSSYFGLVARGCGVKELNWEAFNSEWDTLPMPDYALATNFRGQTFDEYKDKLTKLLRALCQK